MREITERCKKCGCEAIGLVNENGIGVVGCGECGHRERVYRFEMSVGYEPPARIEELRFG